MKSNNVVLKSNLPKIAFLCFLISLCLAFFIERSIDPNFIEERTGESALANHNTGYLMLANEAVASLADVIPYSTSLLRQAKLNEYKDIASLEPHWVSISESINKNNTIEYFKISAKTHYGVWSFLPIFLAIILAFLNREPLTAILSGIIVGSIMLGHFDIIGDVMIPTLVQPGTAAILILTLWMLGGLLGLWNKTGATQAFARFMTQHFVTGPTSAKLMTWLLGVIFFQGGTVSTIIVGTTVKPIADAKKISHEELSYIVDSTASPIASIIPFNVWPVYIQTLIFVPGVTFLATESDRLSFFLQSIPLSLYSIFAVLGTLLLCFNIKIFCGKQIRAASKRATNEGLLDAKNALPMSAKELESNSVPEYYKASILEFVLPLITLIAVASGTFIFLGSPQINWAFGSALVLAFFTALLRGMKLRDLIDGLQVGFKGVVFASTVLLFAIILGDVSQLIGAGSYLVLTIGDIMPYWLLPLCLLALTMITAFSTGTSWGTYPLVFPLAMPLAWAICESQGVQNPELYMMVCFAVVLNGSVYGDQCSPISDTTVLSAMTTGCDLMDHVKSQIIPASYAMALAASLWTLIVLLFC